jgi:hypothetical protein
MPRAFWFNMPEEDKRELLTKQQLPNRMRLKRHARRYSSWNLKREENEDAATAVVCSNWKHWKEL